MNSSPDSSSVEVVVVGPASHSTGGMAQYVKEQYRHVDDLIQLRLYDVTALHFDAGEVPQVIRYGDAIVRSVIHMLQFVFLPRPDVVHVHTSQSIEFFRSMFYVFFTAFIWRQPVVLHVHGSRYDEFLMTDSYPLYVLQSFMFGACDSIIVLSEYWKEVFTLRVPADKVEVIPNAVNVSDYAPEPRTNPPTIVFVADHSERKGVYELAEAAERLVENGVRFRLEIAGKGQLSDVSESLAERYPEVTYHGYVSEAEKQQLLGQGAIYVLPTYAEGLPISILEAMAGENAIVSTTVGSIPEVIGTENGRIVPPGDVDALVTALTDLLENPEELERMARRNRELAEEQYSWARIAERLVTHYEVLTASNR